MLRLGIRNCEGLHLDERELERDGPSYMVDTLSSIREEEGDRPLCLVLGEDSFAGLYLWHRWQEVPKLCHLVVMTRPVDPRPAPPELRSLVEEHMAEDRTSLREQPAGLVLPIKVTALGISATRIRVLLHRGGDARYLLPEAVLDYIFEKGLYGAKRI
jgi:nicotinate-nucleotide adenylyltransferase